MLIRRYGEEDAPAVRRLSPQAAPLQGVVEAGGEAWVAERQGQLLAYAFAAPLPGLPGQLQLHGYVDPAQRRAGIGSQLLERLLAVLSEQEAQQVSCAVERLQEPTARFLQAHGFYLHHEEWRMVLSALDRLPSPPTVPGCRTETLPRGQAIATFQDLYDQSFGDAPWYQPYSADEIAADLQREQDLLFWICGGQPVGFVWLHHEGTGEAEIEPVGLVPSARGRGYGRALLLVALQRLADQVSGPACVRLAVWRENRAAIQLYRQLGFKRSGRRYYLAYDLGQGPARS